MTLARVGFDVRNERLPLAAPFRIAGHVFHEIPVTLATLRDGGCEGRGEAAGVYYLDDRPEGMLATLEALRDEVEAGITRDALRRRLPPGGARNALDCALWELQARAVGLPVRTLAGIKAARPLRTTFTLGADDPARVVEGATMRYAQARALKLKLDGDIDADIARVRRVREARPDAWIGVDANQAYTPDRLDRLMPALRDARVALLEQPFARGREADLDGLERAIPIAADESLQGLDELEALAGRVDVVNIKLDKCGGLTEGLLIAQRARALGMQVMVGNMVGTSWAMAPAFVLGQSCDIVDLDGPLFLSRDRAPGVVYADGDVHCADAVWGAPVAPR